MRYVTTTSLGLLLQCLKLSGFFIWKILTYIKERRLYGEILIPDYLKKQLKNIG